MKNGPWAATLIRSLKNKVQYFPYLGPLGLRHERLYIKLCSWLHSFSVCAPGHFHRLRELVGVQAWSTFPIIGTVSLFVNIAICVYIQCLHTYINVYMYMRDPVFSFLEGFAKLGRKTEFWKLDLKYNNLVDVLTFLC